MFGGILIWYCVYLSLLVITNLLASRYYFQIDRNSIVSMEMCSRSKWNSRKTLARRECILFIKHPLKYALLTGMFGSHVCASSSSSGEWYWHFKWKRSQYLTTARTYFTDMPRPPPTPQNVIRRRRPTGTGQRNFESQICIRPWHSMERQTQAGENLS